jgi:hypothetical protein
MATKIENISPSESSDAYVYTEADLTKDLAELSEGERAKKINQYLDQVKKRWEDAESKRLISKFKEAKKYHEEMVKSTIKPVEGAPSDYAYLVNIEHKSDQYGNSIGSNLVSGTSKVKEFSVSVPKTALAIMQLRRLDDTLLRLIVCHDVADETKVEEEDVFALFRVEGNMSTPPSMGSLEQKIPSGSNSALSSIRVLNELKNLVLVFNDEKMLELIKSTRVG